MTPNPLPLAGWTGWRWSSLVLIGTNPAGVEQSLGEVFKSDRGIEAILEHPTTQAAPMRQTVGTVQFARKTIMEWVRELGGNEEVPNGLTATEAAGGGGATESGTPLGSRRDQLLRLVAARPGILATEAGRALGCTTQRISQLATALGLRRVKRHGTGHPFGLFCEEVVDADVVVGRSSEVAESEPVAPPEDGEALGWDGVADVAAPPYVPAGPAGDPCPLEEPEPPAAPDVPAERAVVEGPCVDCGFDDDLTDGRCMVCVAFGAPIPESVSVPSQVAELAAYREREAICRWLVDEVGSENATTYAAEIGAGAHHGT